MEFGATTLPLTGWMADPQQPDGSRQHRLAAMRQLISGYGLSAIELTLDLAMLFPTVFDEGFYASVAELQQDLGFVCTVHLPFLWVDPASLNEAIRQASVQSLRRAVELSRAVDVQTYVLHLWGLATGQIVSAFEHPTQRQAIHAALAAQAGRSLAEVCELADPRDVCVENLEALPFDLCLPLVEKVGTGICLDVGHLAWQSDDELAFLARHGQRIREVHLHDVTRVPGEPLPIIRDHLALGRGEIEIDAFLQSLNGSGFEGAVILELNSKADLEQSLQRLEAWL